MRRSGVRFRPPAPFFCPPYQNVTVDTCVLLAQNTRLDFWEGFPSGQRGQTVNLLVLPSEVRILPPPPLIRRGESGVAASPMIAGVVQW